ncbi:hypothetical protein IWW38_001457 [Coemansia aciculifera]|uniref:Uncharacterized protein n=1 Tax=Coemansia aciculifera TaxID=417176 RepID=A0ACC1M672_9FUNG|nr:hypothetical protein IWW38_001457 [Coemansia aciculifera]
MDFGGRSCVLPECHSVPRSKFALPATTTATTTESVKSKRAQIENPVYRNVSKWNHTQSLSELMRLSATFLRPEVAHDRALLGRIFYRNWNQHRTAVYFRRLGELRRGLRVLEQCRLRELIEQLGAAFYDAGTPKSGRKISAWHSLPCQHFVTAAAVRISHLVRLAVKLQEICWNAYMHFAAQTAQTLFMPLALVVQGITARLHVVFGVWHQDLVALYVMLLQWLPSLPACPDSLNGLTPAIAAKLVHADELKTTSVLFGDETERAKIAQAASDSGSTKFERQVADLGAMDVVDVVADSLSTISTGSGQSRLMSKKRARQRALDLYEDSD